MKLYLFACEQTPLPGQWAQILFDNREYCCPIYDFSDQYLWCLCPDFFSQGASFQRLCGQPLMKPKENISYCIRSSLYYHSFFWIKSYQSLLKKPLFLELPLSVEFGKIVPSTFFNLEESWLSQYLASLEQIDRLKVVHRLVSKKIEHAFDSFEQIESLLGKTYTLEILQPSYQSREVR